MTEHKNEEAVNETVENETVEGEVQENPVAAFTQEVEVASGRVVETVRSLINEGNVRRVIIKTADDKVLVDTPLNVGVGVLGLGALLGAVPLMLVSAGIGFLAKVKVQVVREVRDGDVVADEGNRIEIDPVEDADPEVADAEDTTED